MIKYWATSVLTNWTEEEGPTPQYPYMCAESKMHPTITSITTPPLDDDYIWKFNRVWVELFTDTIKFNVYAYPIPEGKSGQQVVDSLQKDIELLGAVKTGSFNVDCETYNSVNLPGSQQRLIHVLHNSEQPASCFSVLDTGTTLIADVLFEVLMAKLTQVKAGKDPLYQLRKGFKMESKGPRYELSDFIIKIGSVSMASNFKGILVEVEYCPCSIPAECWNLMRELMQSFLGNVAETTPVLMKNKMDTFYSPGDTINQYLEHFNNFRKQTNMNQAIR